VTLPDHRLERPRLWVDFFFAVTVVIARYISKSQLRMLRKQVVQHPIKKNPIKTRSKVLHCFLPFSGANPESLREPVEQPCLLFDSRAGKQMAGIIFIFLAQLRKLPAHLEMGHAGGETLVSLCQGATPSQKCGATPT
jgi:hypothetical protein